MPMTPQLWSISALAIELGLDRRATARLLANVAPAETKQTGKRTESKWLLKDVFRHGHGGHLDLTQERARLAHEQQAVARLDAEKRTVELARNRGELVPADRVRATAFSAARIARDRILALPDRLAPILAAESDPVRVYDRIAAEARLICEELAGALDVAP